MSATILYEADSLPTKRLMDKIILTIASLVAMGAGITGAVMGLINSRRLAKKTDLDTVESQLKLKLGDVKLRLTDVEKAHVICEESLTYARHQIDTETAERILLQAKYASVMEELRTLTRRVNDK